MNSSDISCLRRSDIISTQDTTINKRYKKIFAQSKGTPFYDFVRVMVNHIPHSFLEILSDDDTEKLYSMLYQRLEERKKKKYTVTADFLNDISFKGNSFCMISGLTDDRPFIFDSLWELLRNNKGSKLFLIHPIFGIVRDDNGAITTLDESRAHGNAESLVVMVLEGISRQGAETLKKETELIYENIIAAVDGYKKMTNIIASTADTYSETQPKTSEFAKWLIKGNFIIQGTYIIDTNLNGDVRNCEAEGIYKLPGIQPNHLPLVAALKENNVADVHSVYIDKSSEHSRVKRRTNFDRAIIIDKKGDDIKITYITGLLSSVAHRATPLEVSILKEKLTRVLDSFCFLEGSHDYKWIRDIIDSYPKIPLFNLSEDQLAEILRLILSIQDVNQIRISYTDFRPLRKLLFFVAMPFETFSSGLVEKIKAHLSKVFNATVMDVNIKEDLHNIYFLHFHLFLESTDILDTINEEDLKTEITAMLKNWNSRLHDILRLRIKGAYAETFARFESYFSEVYKNKTSPEEAYNDIVYIQNDKDMSARLHESNGKAVLRVYSKRRILLTELMPIIDNLGLNVYEHDIFEPKVEGEGLFINILYLIDIENPAEFVETKQNIITDLVEAVLSGKAENDKLNALCVKRNLTWRQTDLLRALVYYAKQIESSFLIRSLTSALTNNCHIAEKLVEFFELKFNPTLTNVSTREIEKEIMSLIEEVQSVSEDKALRYFIKLIQGTVRTNYFMLPERNYMSFKIKSCEVPIIPDPKPMFEIFVHSAEMSGIHLRGGKIARGGIRFSDRNDDFRTEVLGLVKTQIVKNSVIVPVGSKGGFIAKKRYKDREADRLNSIKQYSTLVRGMLDITDNYVGTDVVHPERVKFYDESDPYLVVAADKGTASFSDIANSISKEYNFWLGDGFASGGSTGYDHKKVGITAKGGWENVKRHFRGMGKDIQKEEFTVVGIGDMGGDVFGNAMLLSEKIRLIAAFNHVHIFIDPNPDCASSFEERKRLFNNPSLSWKDYNRELISKGGGVFDRSAKKIELSEEAREALSCTETVVSGTELVRLILKAEAELLWNGGIGTYVKASSENDRDASDSANDDVRINGADLRVKVVGEGGNLGFTQKGRMEFSAKGGRIFTDALDNSGGVDMSDHEVNIKIIFNQLMEEGVIKTVEERNEYIKHLTPEVTKLVLSTNYNQSLAVTCDRIRFANSPASFREAALYLRDKGILDFKIEKVEFPLHNGIATSPEHAVLLAYMKIYIYNNTEPSINIDNPLIRKEYLSYYPVEVVEKYGELLFKHKLLKQIAATVVTNRIINQMGITFYFELMKSTLKSPAELTEIYLIAEELLGTKKIIADICALDGIADAETQYNALIELDLTLKIAVEWLSDDRNMYLFSKEKDSFFNIIKLASKNLPSYVEEAKANLHKNLSLGGITPDVIDSVSGVKFAKAAFDVYRITVETGGDPKDILKKYYEVDQRFGISMQIRKIRKIKPTNEWERINSDRLISKLKSIRVNLAISYEKSNGTLLNNILDTETSFIENYDKFLEIVEKDGIETLIPFNVMAESFALIAQKHGEKGC
jgi:glutamate dehydrogenase